MQHLTKVIKQTNQDKDDLMNSTTNPEIEKDVHKDVEDSNNLEDKTSNNKILPDDATYDKSNQNAKEVQDTSNNTNKNPEDNKNQIISPEKYNDLQESA